MRKIRKKGDDAKKQKRNNTILGMLLIIVMFLSVVGYGFMGQDESGENKKISYNGYEFVSAGDYWLTKIGDYQFGFQNNPIDLEDSDGEVKYLNSYIDKPLYIFSENPEARVELEINLNQVVQRIQDGCLNKDECGGDYPVKSCERENFIIIREENVSEIIQNGTCVTISGSKENLTKMVDIFLLKTIGIED